MARPIYKGGRPFFKPGIQFSNDICLLAGSAAPTDGTSGTGVGQAGPGSTYQRTSGAVYVNTNTKASPTWVSLGVGAASATLTTPTIVAPTTTDSVSQKVLVGSATYSATITAATITGFSWTVVAGATYIFEMELATTQTTVGGLTLNFKLTTATLTSIDYHSYQSTASDNTTAISSSGTTTTDATKVVDNKTAAFTRTRVWGSMVVNAGGTFAWQGTQNTSAGAGDATVILLGSYARLIRAL